MTYTDMDDTPKEGSTSEQAASPENGSTPKSVQRPQRVRRTKSGPQIYGQDSTGGYESAQGVIRKDISAKAPAEEAKSIGTPSNPDTASPVQPVAQEVQLDTQEETAEQAPQPAKAAPAAAESRQRPAQGTGRQAPRGSKKRKKQGKVSRMMETSRRVIRSPLLIIITILNTIYLLASIGAVILKQLNYGLVARLISSINFPSQVSGYVSMFETLMKQLDTDAVIAALLVRVPGLLFCIGLWLLVITVRSAKERMSGSGFALMRICVVLRMIFSCIILLAVLVLAVTLVIAAGSGSSTSVLVLAIGILVAAIVLTMAVIMYYFCYLATLRAVQTNASTGDFYGKVSVFVAVVTIILALPGILNLLSGITNMEITGIITGISRLAWMILFAVWIFCYRRVMSEYEE